MNAPTYDLERVYDEKIAPLVQQILEICKAHDLPMAACFQYKSESEEDYEFCDSAVLPESRPISEKLERMWSILQEQRRVKPLILKVLDEENQTKEITEIQP